MRNQRIVNAYDAINPSAAEKERMLRTILTEATPAPEAKKKKETIVYTAKPTKTSRRSIFVGIAACIAVFMISGYILMNLDSEPVDPAYVEPVTETREESADGIYEEVFAKYSRALNEKWPAEQCGIEGITIKFPAIYYGDTVAGYQLLDLNDDGREELVISDGSAVWDLYTTLEDGTPVQIHCAENDGVLCQLYEGGVIGIELTTKTDAEYGYYRLENNRLTAEEMVIYTDANEQWSRQKGEREWENLSREAAWEILYGYEPLQLQLHYFRPGMDGTLEAKELYTPILEKYKTAILENWTWDQCEEADISPQIILDTTITNDFGWCLLDIDENGTQELIISDGIHLFDLYGLMPDGAPGHIIMASGDNYTLCRDRMIEKFTPFSKGMSRTYYEFSGIDLMEKSILVYRNEYQGGNATGKYYYGSDEDHLETITKDEAGAIISRYGSLELKLTAFGVESPEPELGAEHYAPLLAVYRQALAEGWNPGECDQNGISLMVGYYGELYDDLGYALMDISNDGIAELIITDGNNIYDLYTLISDEEVGPVRVLTGTERNTYWLTKGDKNENLIFNWGSGGAAVSYYTYSTLSGVYLILQEGYMYDADTDPENPWFYYDGTERGEPCGDFDAEAVVNGGYSFLEIPFESFA